MYRCNCGREFKIDQHYDMHKPYCKGPKYCQNIECKKLLNHYQQKFCSAACSAKVTVKGRRHTIETREKISKTLGGKGNIKQSTSIQNYCLNCLKPIIYQNKYCNIYCQHEYKYKKSVEDWLKNPKKYTSPKGFMKKWLIENGGEKCHRCGWNQKNKYTKKIPLEMHHEDGKWRNNSPENLDLVCPNCHSLTSTYRYGNKGHGRKAQREYYKGKTTKKDVPVAQLDAATDF